MLLSVVVGALQSADGPFSSLLPSAAKEGLTAQPPEQPAADRDEQVAARVAAIHRIDVLAPAAAKITNTSAPNATHRGGGAKGAKVDARVAERLRMRQRARARGRASALAESKDALCDNFVAKFAPPAANTCAELEQRDRPLIIVAGDGRTGTGGLARAISMLGLRVSHRGQVYECAGRGPHPVDGSSCDWAVNPDPAVAQHQQELSELLVSLPSSEYDGFDWCRFGYVDAIEDEPIPQLFPLIYRAHGDNTKVILTVRNATEWVERRDQWLSYGAKGVSDVAPLAAGFASSVANATLMRDGASLHEMRSHSAALTAYSYMAMSALAICLVPRQNLLVLNVFEQSDAELWRQLRTFLAVPDAKDMADVAWPQASLETPDPVGRRVHYESIEAKQRGSAASESVAETFGPQFIMGKSAAGLRPAVSRLHPEDHTLGATAGSGAKTAA